MSNTPQNQRRPHACCPSAWGWWLVFMLLGAPYVVADVLKLKGGGVVEGQLVNPDQTPRTVYVLMLDTGGEITIGVDDVESFVPTSEAERRYKALLARMPDSADGNWRLAQWCGEIGLPANQERHLEEAIRLDPDHEKARRALGYSRISDRWIIPEDWMRDQGYVLHEGRWMFPQDVEIAQRRDAYESAVITWNRNLKRWRGWYGRKKWKEGLQNIEEITDPLAAESLVNLLSDEAIPELQRLFILVLGRLQSPLATKAFIQIVLGPSTDDMRDLALDQLEQHGGPVAIDAFIRMLKSKDNLVVRRSAVGLRRLQDPRAIRPLIDALITQHKVVVGEPSGQLSTSFGGSSAGGGGIGFSAGGGQKTVIKQVKNREVLDALLPLAGGVNYQYNQGYWKDWYYQVSTPRDLNLRRAK